MTTPVVNTHPDTGAITKEKKNIVIPESPPLGGASHWSCDHAVAKRLHGEGGAGGVPEEFFHTLSCGGMRGWPVPSM